MSVPSMVHRSGDSLIVRSVVSGDALFGSAAGGSEKASNVGGGSIPDVGDTGSTAPAAAAAAATAVVASATAAAPAGCDASRQQPQQQQRRQSSSLPECRIKRNYSCPDCEYLTQNPRDHLYHLRDVHGEKVRIYECPCCVYASRHFQKLARHARMVHGDGETPDVVSAESRGRTAAAVNQQQQQQQMASRKRPHASNDEEDELSAAAAAAAAADEDVSSYDDGAEEDAAGGAADKTAPSVFKCSVCSFAARNQAQLTRHEREEHIKTKFFRCTKCSYVTHMKARFTKHVKYHSMPMIKCDMCDFRTPYKWNLDRHCKNHNGRGAFRCSACNFTADIKQSLTVHEMNHHVPPVGQAAGLGVGRRRNKVGASDATAAEDAQAQAQVAAARQEHHPEVTVTVERVEEDDDRSRAVAASAAAATASTPAPFRPKAAPKKATTKPANLIAADQLTTCAGNFGSDFIHPDDIIHHANGNVYIKNKCKLCNFKTAWDSEMAKHERKMHGIDRDEPQQPPLPTAPAPPPQAKAAKKPCRPVPNLIPIPAQSSLLKVASRLTGPPVLKAAEPPAPLEPSMSQEAINEICARSANSSLKDFASLFNSESLFKDQQDGGGAHAPKVPDLIPASVYASSATRGGRAATVEDHFKMKNASFFDQLKEKLLTSAGDSVCRYCGHQSKCLTEQAAHQKVCGREGGPASAVVPVHNFSSSRCQYCRQRCKSSVDLFNHLKTCPEALKTLIKKEEPIDYSDRDDEEGEGELRIDEDACGPDDGSEPDVKPHPMEHKVFVWNNIEVPMDLEVDDSNYEYTEDRLDDNGSLDLSVRTHSPGGSENSYVSLPQDYSLVHQSSPVLSAASHASAAAAASSAAAAVSVAPAEKIPTHGNDISVAQHKRVFKCPHCTFWASTASRFHVHIVGHLNKKPFECSLCAYRSNWRWDITKHIKLKSVRDPAHESAKVLMTDETGRRNYSKYNAYLTEIPVSGEHTADTSGGSGTRARHLEPAGGHPSPGRGEAGGRPARAAGAAGAEPGHTQGLRPPPPLKAASEVFFAKKRASSDSKRTHFKCKKCNFKDPSRETLLAHVKGHYPQSASGAALQGALLSAGGAPATLSISLQPATPPPPPASSHSPHHLGQQPLGGGGAAASPEPRDERHCRLKHNGDIRVVSNKNGQERVEIEEHIDEPDHVDVPQTGTFKCNACPFSNDDHVDFEVHMKGHTARPDSVMKCYYCKFFVSRQEDLLDHLKLHGIADTEEFLARMLERNDGDGKKFKCLTCPYVSNSKSQFTYHRQFHRPRGNQYNCSKCSYNVSKRHLLHQHLKVHGINITPQKQNGEVIDLDEISDEIEEVPSGSSTAVDAQSFADIPLVWVSKDGRFSKMFKCRYCPHVNLRKVNIQEHEKMHSIREKNGIANKISEVEHHCTECNYVCNNAGVLSSHTKVHQGLYGTVHSLVDFTKSDEDQIKEFNNFTPVNPQMFDMSMQEEYENAEATALMEMSTSQNDENAEILYFCNECPARFLKENEYNIHLNFHSRRLFYKCDYCTYTARQKPHLMAHNKVHTTEYQDETRTLKEHYVSGYQPRAFPIGNGTGDLIWKVHDNNKTNDLDMDIETYNSITKPRSSQSIPLSGTELFQQKSEAQLKHNAEMAAAQQGKDQSPPPQKPADPQFGTLMHGNPNFIYPTYLKNGKMKEKRYKCHKCPSAFEKREQYKVHLGLHGSKQRYQCESCDYSVKYYANYVQHSKKHKMNEDAQAAKKSEDDEEMDEIEDSEPLVTNDSLENNGKVPCVIDNQKCKVTSPAKDSSAEDKKLYSCPNCPYTNFRRDAVDNHQKRHSNISGIQNNYTCEHCDYSVPQQHFLRDHTKLHFSPNKNSSVEGFMVCDNLKLMSNICEEEKREDVIDGDIIFEEQGAKVNDKSYLPPISADISERFNNNEGEKQLVDINTGELISDKQSSGSNEECKME